MVTTTGDMSGLKGVNEASNKVLRKIQNIKTPKEAVQEFFGLRVETIYADDGEEVIDMINEFKDKEALRAKGVQFTTILEEMGIHEGSFNAMFPNGLPNLKEEVDVVTDKEAEPMALPKIEAKTTKNGTKGKTGTGGNVKAKTK